MKIELDENELEFAMEQVKSKLDNDYFEKQNVEEEKLIGSHADF